MNKQAMKLIGKWTVRVMAKEMADVQPMKMEPILIAKYKQKQPEPDVGFIYCPYIPNFKVKVCD